MGVDQRLTDSDLRAGEDLLFQFIKGKELSQSDRKFAQLCKCARGMRGRLGRNPTIAEAMEEMDGNDFLLTCYGPAAAVLERASELHLTLTIIIADLQDDMLLARCRCGIYPHVAAGTLYAWLQVSSNRPGDLAGFETVHKAVKRQPDLKELIDAARK